MIDLCTTIRSLCNRLRSLCNRLRSLCNKKRPHAKIPTMDFFIDIFRMTNTGIQYKSVHRGPNNPIGKTILALYLVEVFIKRALEDSGETYGYNHNLHRLYKRLPKEKRDDVEEVYCEIFPSEERQKRPNSENLESVAVFLKSLGDDPITETRYFWDSKYWNSKEREYHLFPDDIDRVAWVLAVVLHNYPREALTRASWPSSRATLGRGSDDWPEIYKFRLTSKG